MTNKIEFEADVYHSRVGKNWITIPGSAHLDRYKVTLLPVDADDPTDWWVQETMEWMGIANKYSELTNKYTKIIKRLLKRLDIPTEGK